MRDRKLRIGRIPYANLFPIFYALEKECDCSSYEFVEGVPSKVNRMLRDGGIDVSPSSSIEYLRNPLYYRIIDSHSVSSRGPVGSIFLFSSKPIEELDGTVVYATSQSETSVGLLEVVLKKFYGVHCTVQSSKRPESSGGEAFLLIGDDALKYSNSLLNEVTRHSLLSYDLGEIWYRRTGLPFVFALWIIGAGCHGEEGWRQKLLNNFVKDLDNVKVVALKNLSGIAKHAPLRTFMSEEEIISYWSKLDYELTAEHRKGLELFNQYLKELSYF
ncbi:MAG: menaquinone biosynthesis protein [Nitrospirae bacterium]|nr:menaquinone biosynthesis protein [Nitrospirota bacterium]